MLVATYPRKQRYYAEEARHPCERDSVELVRGGPGYYNRVVLNRRCGKMSGYGVRGSLAKFPHARWPRDGLDLFHG